MTKQNLFGTAGIRGIANKDITPETALKLGKTFSTFLPEDSTVLIGRDTRTSSEMIKNAVVSGLLSTGCNVKDAGVIPIPLVNFSVKDKYDGGVMITSSHNPPEWNGLKFILKTGIEISGQDEERFEELFENENFRKVKWNEVGVYEEVDAVPNYIDRTLISINEEKIRAEGIKIAADLADGAQGNLFPKLLEKAGVEHEIIHTGKDGKFSRPPEPTDDSLSKLKSMVKKGDYDLGVAFDCDGDRMVSVTSEGKVIEGDVLGTVISDYLLQKKPGLIVTPIATSSVIDEIVEKHGAEIKRTRVGSKYVAKLLKEKDGLFGFEESDGFVFPNFNLTKDGAFAAMKLMDILADTGETLTDLVEKLPKYHQIKKKVDCKNEKKEETISKIKEDLDKKHSTLDGLKIFFEDGWVLIRPSGTEPILRVYAESKDKKRAKELSKWGIEKVKSAL